MEPCKNENKIGHLEGTVDTFKSIFLQFNETQKELVSVLRDISSQGTDIATLKNDRTNLFERMQKVEVRIERAQVKIAFIVALATVFASGFSAWIIKLIAGK